MGRAGGRSQREWPLVLSWGRCPPLPEDDHTAVSLLPMDGVQTQVGGVCPPSALGSTRQGQEQR